MSALSHGTLLTSSVADLDSDIYGAEIRHSQLSRGVFLGRLQGVELRNSVFDSGLFNQRLIGNGAMPEEAFTFIFIYTPPGDGYLNNRPLSKGVWLFQPGDEIHAIIPADFHWCSISIRGPELEARLETIGMDPAELCKLGSGPVGHANTNILEQILNCMSVDSHSAGIIGNAEDIEERLLFGFLDTCKFRRHCAVKAGNKYRILGRAEDQLRSNMNMLVSATDLSRDIGCSRRKIETIFRETYEMGPIAFHRMLRLNEAHRHLLNGEGEPGAVAVIATNFAFTHLGRFSADYKAVFGEYPHQTSKRTVGQPRLEVTD